MSTEPNVRVRQRTRAANTEAAIATEVTHRIVNQPPTVLKSEVERVDAGRYVPVDELTPAYVTVGNSETVNIGNFESVKATVQVTLPCLPTKEAVEATLAMAADLVNARMEVELAGTNPAPETE